MALEKKQIFAYILYIVFAIQYYIFEFHNKHFILNKINFPNYFYISIFFIIPILLFFISSNRLKIIYLLIINIGLLALNVYGVF